MYHDGSCLVDFSLFDVLPQAKAEWFLAEIRQTLAENRLRIVEYTLAGEDVSEIDENAGPPGDIWFEGRVKPMRSRVDGERAVLWLASNISQRHHLETRLRQLSETDELTGICNRRHFMQILGDRLAEYAPDATAITLLIIDIDHFKPINDQYGHLDGDRIIKALIAVCVEQLDGTALLARLGGEEFAVLLSDITPSAALRIAEQLRAAVAGHHFELECGTVIPVTISIGASVVRPFRRRLNELLRDADIALYEAKSGGRNRVVMARDPDRASRRA
tara:strand:+ start:244 stop:1071 length:828 start_codon:yes stop_codon:yes gene_type:complete